MNDEYLPKKLVVIFSEEQIARRIAELGQEISRFYHHRPLTLVAIANGGLFFCADLARAIKLPLQIDVIAAGSYHNDRAGDELVVRSKLKLDPRGRDLLLVDEVLDTGRTLRILAEQLRNLGAASVRTVVAVEKSRERPDGLAGADWRGFLAPDRYLVGYGLDSRERFRNLPCIAMLPEELR